MQEPESKYLMLWICVIIAAAIIFAGWIFSLKYNFYKINQETEKNVNKSTEQAVEEVKEMFKGVGSFIKQREEIMENSKNEEENLEKGQSPAAKEGTQFDLNSKDEGNTAENN